MINLSDFFHRPISVEKEKEESINICIDNIIKESGSMRNSPEFEDVGKLLKFKELGLTSSSWYQENENIANETIEVSIHNKKAHQFNKDSDYFFKEYGLRIIPYSGCDFEYNKLSIPNSLCEFIYQLNIKDEHKVYGESVNLGYYYYHYNEYIKASKQDKEWIKPQPVLTIQKKGFFGYVICFPVQTKDDRYYLIIDVIG